MLPTITTEFSDKVIRMGRRTRLTITLHNDTKSNFVLVDFQSSLKLPNGDILPPDRPQYLNIPITPGKKWFEMRQPIDPIKEYKVKKRRGKYEVFFIFTFDSSSGSKMVHSKADFEIV